MGNCLVCSAAISDTEDFCDECFNDMEQERECHRVNKYIVTKKTHDMSEPKTKEKLVADSIRRVLYLSKLLEYNCGDLKKLDGCMPGAIQGCIITYYCAD